MDSLKSLRDGDLHATLAQVKQEVRTSPRDPKLRVFLFQLFCVAGDWDRALTQLTVASELDKFAVPMMQTYQAAIRCEVLRTRVFAGARTPTVFGEPQPWMSLLIEANRRLAAGAAADAATLRDDAFEAAPSTAGTMDGKNFDWVADADPRLGPMLEAVIDGRYFWVPFHRLQSLTIEPPADLRDLVWMPARFTWSNGGETVGFIPARYPGSAEAGDPALALGRRTEWRQDGDWHLGLGQRMFATDTGEQSLLNVRRIEIRAGAEAAAA